MDVVVNKLIAMSLMLPALGSVGQVPPLPAPVKSAAAAAPAITNRYVFAATAVDKFGLESDYSNEVGCTNLREVALAWDRSPGTNTVTNYFVYWGGTNWAYTTRWPAGTNLTVTLRSPNMVPRTNVVVTVTTTRATNLLAANSLRGPWLRLNATNWTRTNGISPQYWRAVGRTRPTLAIGTGME